MMLESNSLADIEAGGLLHDGLGKIANGDITGGLTDLAKVPKRWLVVPDAYRTWSEGRSLQKEALAGHLEDPAVRDVILGGGSFDFGDSVMAEGMSNAIGETFGVVGAPGAARGGAWPAGWAGPQRGQTARQSGKWPQGWPGQKPQKENRRPAQRAASAPRSQKEVIEIVIAVIRARFGHCYIGLKDNGIRSVGGRYLESQASH